LRLKTFHPNRTRKRPDKFSFLREISLSQDKVKLKKLQVRSGREKGGEIAKGNLDLHQYDRRIGVKWNVWKDVIRRNFLFIFHQCFDVRFYRVHPSQPSPDILSCQSKYMINVLTMMIINIYLITVCKTSNRKLLTFTLPQFREFILLKFLPDSIWCFIV